MTALDVQKIVQFRNELKENELKELKHYFPVNNLPLDEKNWIKLYQLCKVFHLSYKLTYSEVYRKYYLIFLKDGVIFSDSLTINKNDFCKKSKFNCVQRHIIGEWLRRNEFIK